MAAGASSSREPRRITLHAPTALVASTVGMATVGFSTPAYGDQAAVCRGQEDPYHASAATRNACGIRSFPLVRKIVHADGSKDYVYFVDGHKVDWPVPPTGWDAATASPSDRGRFGIPPEPPVADGAYHAAWAQALHRLRFGTPPAEILQVPVENTPTELSPPSPELQQELAANGASVDLTSPTWAGELATQHNFAEVDATYTEPPSCTPGTPATVCADTTQCPNAAAAYWVGLGGVGNVGVPLGQDGTNAPSTRGGQYLAWWAVGPNTPPGGAGGYLENVWPATTFAAGEGNVVYQRTSYDVNTGQYTFEVFDNTTGQAAGPINVTDSDINESTADYVVERPAINGVHVPLLRFGSMGWKTSGLSVQDANAVVEPRTTNLLGVPLDMVNGSDLIAAAVQNNDASNGGFTVENWKNCQ